MSATTQQNTNSDRRYLSHVSPLRGTIEFNPAGETIHLRNQQHVNMHDANGWAVKALSGAVWITQDGDIRDIVLEAGQSFVLDHHGGVLISPLGEAEISFAR